LSKVPEAVREKFDALRAENLGSRLQVAAWEVKGELVYFAHAIDGDHAQVLAVTAQGAISAQGTALEQDGAAGWKVKWR